MQLLWVFSLAAENIKRNTYREDLYEEETDCFWNLEHILMEDGESMVNPGASLQLFPNLVLLITLQPSYEPR